MRLFLCECDSEDCAEKLPLTDSQFMAARMVNWRAAIVLPGHQSPDDEVILERENYLVVRKQGELSEPA